MWVKGFGAQCFICTVPCTMVGAAGAHSPLDLGAPLPRSACGTDRRRRATSCRVCQGAASAPAPPVTNSSPERKKPTPAAGVGPSFLTCAPIERNAASAASYSRSIASLSAVPDSALSRFIWAATTRSMASLTLGYQGGSSKRVVGHLRANESRSVLIGPENPLRISAAE